MRYQTINPCHGELLRSFDEHTDQQLETAITTATECFETWRTLTFAKRAVIVAKAAAIMRRRTKEFAHSMTLEMGNIFEESVAEVMLSADILDYYATHAESFLAPHNLKPDIGVPVIESLPLGVIFGMQPWNFPYFQLARFAGPNLMAGNVVMIKHAGSVPQCAIAFEQLWAEAGAPDGACTNLRISPDQVLALIIDPRIRGVALTGVTDVAGSVAERTGKHVKKSRMELGGSGAFIVLDDTDLDRTLNWAVLAKMNNMGQCCVAAKRFIILDHMADLFLAKLTAAMGTLRPGDPMDKSTTLAPLATEADLLKLVKQVENAIAHGATLLLGGKRMDRPGAFMQPTLLADIHPDNPAYREEFFGPVALLFRVKDKDAAIALAEYSDHGRGGSLDSQDIDRDKGGANRLENRMGLSNHPAWSAPDRSFDGIKKTGFRRERSSHGIHEFVHKKLVRAASADSPA